MARDFRPKGARGKKAPRQDRHKKGEKSATGANSVVQAGTAKPRREWNKGAADVAVGTGQARDGKVASSALSSDDEDEVDEAVDDETLLREIKSMGGDEQDLDLIKKQSKAKGKAKASQASDDDDPDLGNDVLSFMKQLDYKAAGVEAPKLEIAAKSQDKQKSSEPKPSKPEKAAPKKVALEREGEPKSTEDNWKAQREAKAAERKQDKAKRQQQVQEQGQGQSSAAEAPQKPVKGSSADEFVFPPTTRWSEAILPPLPTSAARTKVNATSDAKIAAMQARGKTLLDADNARYASMTASGTGQGHGMLSSSDAKFISELLAPGGGAKGGTLSDRIAALTLLAQSSPVHNVQTLETLLSMAGKKNREESGRATRALADVLAKGGGLGERKLRYFRDQPTMAQLAILFDDGDAQTRKIVDIHLMIAAFEDRLKKFYFEFLQTLETQTHDTLPFVRKQAVSQTFILLRDKAEQEQNLLRLITNKLGDGDRSVASAASNSLLQILTVHPAMKAIIVNEVANLIMRPVGITSTINKDPSLSNIGRHNAHARYYGTLTLNQTMLTKHDEAVANRLVNIYFELFNEVLREMDKADGGKEETIEDAAAKEEAQQNAKKDKGRWKNNPNGKGKKGKGKGTQHNPQDDDKVVQDADAKLMAAILTGVRRAMPFAKVDTELFAKHIDTLFRITHTSTFNIALQALQLIYQVSISTPTSFSSSSASSSSANGSSTLLSSVGDRFYRALYASLLDPRLATTSKQAMYLNLLYKAVKSDDDDKRTKAFVKRFTQTLLHAEPPWICGSLFLLGELFTAKPGLRMMLTEPEEDDEEHFYDVPDDGEDGEGKADGASKNGDVQRQTLDQGKKKEYDPLKREPQYAQAEMTCLWEMNRLTEHFHPSVSLHAKQILAGERVTTTADLTLNTLSHFLDLFVFRNPKKGARDASKAKQKGVSIMQPAAAAASAQGAAMNGGGVVRIKGGGVGMEEYVNSEAFWKKKAGQVPVDQLFFHKYFNQKLERSKAASDAAKKSHKERKAGEDEEVESSVGAAEDDEGAEDSDDVMIEGEDEMGGSDEDNEDDEDEDEDSDMEAEIWKEMKRTMPRENGDEALDEEDEDEDDEDLEMYEGSDGEEDGEEGMFEEEEDDLLPFHGFDEDGSDDDEEDVVTSKSGAKRKLGEDGDGEEDGKQLSKGQLKRREKKKRKALPTFASAEDYAHLLGKDDSDED